MNKNQKKYWQTMEKAWAFVFSKRNNNERPTFKTTERTKMDTPQSDSTPPIRDGVSDKSSNKEDIQ